MSIPFFFLQAELDISEVDREVYNETTAEFIELVIIIIIIIISYSNYRNYTCHTITHITTNSIYLRTLGEKFVMQTDNLASST